MSSLSRFFSRFTKPRPLRLRRGFNFLGNQLKKRGRRFLNSLINKGINFGKNELKKAGESLLSGRPDKIIDQAKSLPSRALYEAKSAVKDGIIDEGKRAVNDIAKKAIEVGTGNKLDRGPPINNTFKLTEEQKQMIDKSGINKVSPGLRPPVEILKKGGKKNLTRHEAEQLLRNVRRK